MLFVTIYSLTSKNSTSILRAIESKTLSNNIDISTFTSDSSLLAVSTGNHLKIFTINGGSNEILEIYTEAITVKITSMSFSKDSQLLAIADEQRRIKVYKRDSGSFIKHPTQWCNHSARIDVLCWIQMNSLLSVGVDGCIMAWSLDHSKNSPMTLVRNAHSAPINCIIENEDGMIISGAADSCMRVWEFK